MLENGQLNFLTVEILCAMLGGLIGSLKVFDKYYDNKGFFASAVNVLVGVVFAAATIEYFVPQAKPFAASVIGIAAGSVGGFLIDALQETAPSVAKKILDRFLEKMFDIKPKIEEEDDINNKNSE